LAGLGRKEFNSGDILLASEVQGYLQDQAVMVFDDATARGSAIPNPSEGMLTYNKATDSLELYDGSAFGSISNAGLIHIETRTMSAVAQENLNSVFSSTYKKYKIIITQSASTSNGQTYIRLRAGSTTDATSNYFFGSQNITSAASSTVVSGNPSTVFYIGNAFSATLGSTAYYEIILHNPFESTRTGISWNGYSFDNTVEQARVGSGILKTTTSYDGFSYLVSGGNATAVISVYGFKE
jgi:hypothetical protein